MITLKELNPRGYAPTKVQAANLKKLHEAINKVRAAYGRPMYVTSGLRSVELQRQVNPKAMKSNHLKGLACDISDVDGKLWAWCLANMTVLEEAGLYLECKTATPTWVHFQAAPPRSGKRIFKP